MKRAIFVDAARDEFLAEIAYYNDIESGLGARFLAAIEKATALALAFPLAGSPSYEKTRRLIVKGFPYCVFYRPIEEGVVVFAVAHQAKKSGYWRPRTK